MAERPELPPYPENPQTRQGKRLSPEKVQALKAQYGFDTNPQETSTISGPAAPEDNYNDGWTRQHETLNVSSGWFTFHGPIVEKQSCAGVILTKYETEVMGYPSHRCWFDLFEGNRCCLRITVYQNKSRVTYNQVVNNQWTEEINYDYPDVLNGQDVSLRVVLLDGQFSVIWNDEGADLDWGAAATSMEYRADPVVGTRFGDSVTGAFVYKA